MSTVTTNLGMIKAEGSDIVNVVDHISNNLQILDNTFAANTPSTQAIGDAAAQGSALVVARSDHKHAMPGFGTPVAVSTAIGNGASANVSRADHVHELGNGSVDTTAFFTDRVITQIKTDYGVARQNFCANPSFNNWQRGTVLALTATAYGPDRWQWNRGGTSTVTLTKTASGATFPRSENCMTIAYTEVGSNSYIRQAIENYKDYRGMQITFSADILCSVASAIRISVHDGISQTLSSFHTGTGGVERLTVTHTVSTSSTQLWLLISLEETATTAIANCMAIIGASGTDYIAPNPQEDLALCQRYYYRIENPNAAFNVIRTLVGQCISTTVGRIQIPFPVPMRIAPTMTVSAVTDFHVSTAGFAANATTNFVAGPALAQPTLGAIVDATTAAALVAGNACQLFFNNASGKFIAFDAEMP